MALKDTFTHNLVKLRKRAGLKQSDVSAMVEKSLTCIGQWERGETFPSYGALEKIAKAYGVEAEELFLKEDSKGVYVSEERLKELEQNEKVVHFLRGGSRQSADTIDLSFGEAVRNRSYTTIDLSQFDLMPCA